jgi:hypothetical protein
VFYEGLLDSGLKTAGMTTQMKLVSKLKTINRSMSLLILSFLIYFSDNQLQQRLLNISKSLTSLDLLRYDAIPEIAEAETRVIQQHCPPGWDRDLCSLA